MTSSMSNVLVDHLSRSQRATVDLVWVVGLSLLTALLAQLAVPLPFSPVPISGQTFGVLLAGAALGRRRGFLSQALYLAEGAAGLPVFAGGAFSAVHLFGPTGGYLWSFPLAAGLVGWLVERGASRRIWRMAVALVSADVLILTCGTLWLYLVPGVHGRQAWRWGFYPFLVVDILKIVLVAAPLPIILEMVGRGERGEPH